ncbi:4'-phosphopantetheinyl transferase family protein [Lyngbya confervoides]|uniref:4'-phosphopantetheinyl transferase superfamily protein n=1 Tax=Lyngbya confervoides BDU141951 TaxID=1574623 RepID=A0ABD4SY56_9CYAN|nr:4'-phosphopantetheinyl transferase superfamily protein [Lyngbya confervoides]MCM1981335.1 4'-phosphopantetheinyl transferase superfamily protein [Lyngbya confervoides BDU141951]
MLPLHPIVPPLTPKSIHLWWMHPQSLTLPLGIRVLAEDEQKRCQTLRIQRDRQTFAYIRTVLRFFLARYTGLSPQEIQFHYGPKGKPALVAAQNPQAIQFNISHSHGRVLLGFAAQAPLGLDIEWFSPKVSSRSIAQRFFTPGEYKALEFLNPDQCQALFFQIWTRKEACIKAKGGSLFEEIGQLEVPSTLEPLGQWTQVWSTPRLFVRDLPVGPDYAAAVATTLPVPSYHLEEIKDPTVLMTSLGNGTNLL